MFVYALGIGLLFFLIGAFSISLPKSGAWMDTVKSVFGVALLAAALVFLKNALPATRRSSARRAGRPSRRPRPRRSASCSARSTAASTGRRAQRVAKGLGVALLVGGIVYAAGAADARERRAGGRGLRLAPRRGGRARASRRRRGAR